ncbi:MAG: ATP-binding cassette domain-containing protein [Oscillospiraceae bacterium]|nr:ATP-binding cassette domain-containing protein [Oscillospiraceae bacterium]
MRIAAFTKTYKGRLVLNMPETTLADGKITAVIGANGSGKSTLARVLSGIETADRKLHPLSGVAVGYMPQKSYAFRMSTERNIALNGGDAARRERLMNALRLQALGKQRAKKLSGGETAKMALARILMGRYELLILDEPTAAMDMESTLAAECLLADYCRESGCTVLLVTHSIQQARRLADEVIFLHKGEPVEQGETSTVLSTPAQPLTRRFLEFYGL